MPTISELLKAWHQRGCCLVAGGSGLGRDIARVVVWSPVGPGTIVRIWRPSECQYVLMWTYRDVAD